MRGARFMQDVADSYNCNIERVVEEMENFIYDQAQKGKYLAKMPFTVRDFTEEVISILEENGYKVKIPKDKSCYVEVSWK